MESMFKVDRLGFLAGLVLASMSPAMALAASESDPAADNLLTSLLTGGCGTLLGIGLLAIFWLLVPFILDATRSWAKKSHAELAKQTALLVQIDRRLATIEAAITKPIPSGIPVDSGNHVSG